MTHSSSLQLQLVQNPVPLGADARYLDPSLNPYAAEKYAGRVTEIGGSALQQALYARTDLTPAQISLIHAFIQIVPLSKRQVELLIEDTAQKGNSINTLMQGNGMTLYFERYGLQENPSFHQLQKLNQDAKDNYESFKTGLSKRIIPHSNHFVGSLQMASMPLLTIENVPNQYIHLVIDETHKCHGKSTGRLALVFNPLIQRTEQLQTNVQTSNYKLSLLTGADKFFASLPPSEFLALFAEKEAPGGMLREYQTMLKSLPNFAQLQEECNALHAALATSEAALDEMTTTATDNKQAYHDALKTLLKAYKSEKAMLSNQVTPLKTVVKQIATFKDALKETTNLETARLMIFDIQQLCLEAERMLQSTNLNLSQQFSDLKKAHESYMAQWKIPKDLQDNFEKKMQAHRKALHVKISKEFESIKEMIQNVIYTQNLIAQQNGRPQPAIPAMAPRPISPPPATPSAPPAEEELSPAPSSLSESSFVKVPGNQPEKLSLSNLLDTLKSILGREEDINLLIPEGQKFSDDEIGKIKEWFTKNKDQIKSTTSAYAHANYAQFSSLKPLECFALLTQHAKNPDIKRENYVRFTNLSLNNEIFDQTDILVNMMTHSEYFWIKNDDFNKDVYYNLIIEMLDLYDPIEDKEKASTMLNLCHLWIMMQIIDFNG